MSLLGAEKPLSKLIICLAIFIPLNIVAQVLPSQKDAIRSLQRQAEQRYLAGDYPNSIKLFRQAVQLSIQAKDKARQADLFVESSTIYFVNGQVKEAIYFCRSAINLAPQPSLDSIRFKAFSSLSYYLSELRKTDSSQYFINKADQLLDQNPSLVSQTPAYIAAYHNQRGLYYNNIGEYSQAEIHFQKAFNLGKQYHLSDLFPFFSNNLSRLYAKLGFYQKALTIAFITLENTKEDFRKIPYLTNISHLYLTLNNLSKSHSYLSKAQELYNRYEKNMPPEAAVSEPSLYRNWGGYYKATHQFKKALHYYNKALKSGHLKWGEHNDYLSVIYRDKAHLLEQVNDLSGALTNYRYAMNAIYLGVPLKSYHDLPNIHSGILSENELLESLIGQASILKKLSKENNLLLPSFNTYKLALELSEKIRLTYALPEAKLFLNQKVSAVNDDALAVAFELYQKTHQPQYLEQAFRLTESVRASTLSDARREQNLKQRYVTPNLLLEENQIKNRVSSLKVAFMQSSSAEDQEYYKLKLLEEELTLDKFRHKLRQLIPESQRQASQPVQIATIQKKLLESETALISYVLTAQDLYAFIITTQQVKWVKIPFGHEEKNILTRLQKSLYDNPGIDPYRGHSLAHDAYNILFQPLKSSLASINRLIIIRDKELNYLPFEVLEQSTKDHHYLLRDYSIRYAYGASMAQIQQTTNGKGFTNALAMAPFSDSSVEKNPMRDKSLSPLPASLEEIHSVRGRQFVNNTATKEEFLEHYAKAQVIHLATHARTDDKEVERSFIAFYPNSSNYKLYTDELYNLSFNHTQMIVLSACETGLGRLHRGEGLMSLARAFLYGGCPSVVTTLWNAHDQSSAFLSERMYHHLHQGLPIDKALQKAKLDFFSSKLGASYDHPYYWANLVLIGDATVIYESQWTVAGRIALGFGLLSGIFLFIFLTRAWFYTKK